MGFGDATGFRVYKACRVWTVRGRALRDLNFPAVQSTPRPIQSCESVRTDPFGVQDCRLDVNSDNPGLSREASYLDRATNNTY